MSQPPSSATEPVNPSPSMSAYWNQLVKGTADLLTIQGSFSLESKETSLRVVKATGAIFALFAACLLIAALIIQYPTASNTFFTIMGTASFVAGAALIYAAVKHYDIDKTWCLPPAAPKGNENVPDPTKPPEGGSTGQ